MKLSNDLQERKAQLAAMPQRTCRECLEEFPVAFMRADDETVCDCCATYREEVKH